MKNRKVFLVVLFPAIVFLSCTSEDRTERDMIKDPFVAHQAELREVVDSLASDLMNANITGLQGIHLQSGKFTKFGPRRFDRQDVAATNKSETEYFSSIAHLKYEVRDLKIDVFGDIGVVTYYPHVSYVKDGEQRAGSGRQTLVFLKTTDGWKIVHEHGTPSF